MQNSVKELGLGVHKALLGHATLNLANCHM
jgi:hypothetical protein